MKGVVAGHGEAQADFDATRGTAADAAQRLGEGTDAAAKGVMHVADAVHRDADVIKAGALDAVGHGLVHQGAVGGQRHAGKAQPLGLGRQLEDVGAQQRLAARQDQRRHAEGSQIGHDRDHLARTQLAAEILVGGAGITVAAQQIAAPHQIPDHHRPPWVAARAQRRRRIQFAQELAQAEHGSPLQVSRRPVFLRMRVLNSTRWPRSSSPSAAANSATSASASLAARA